MAIILNGDTGISSIGALSGVTSVSSAAADTPVILQDSSSNSNTCRAWVNFNGTGTVAIRADFNVSSLTDHGTGNYSINFTNSMSDTNYCAVGTLGIASNRNAMITWETINTGSLRMFTYSQLSAANADQDGVHIAVFR